MDNGSLLSSELTDKNGKIINVGDPVLYKDQTYIAMCVDKDGIGWIGHPCGNNSNLDSIMLDDVHDEVEITHMD